jgi:hypothetical protein
MIALVREGTAEAVATALTFAGSPRVIIATIKASP